MLHGTFNHLLLSYFVFVCIAASSQFFNFLATSCVAFLVKTALHLQFTTQVYSLTLGLICPIDWLSTNVVFEIQAHAVTRIMRILNFFAPKFGSPCCTQSRKNFSELNFHQENPVELFVQSVLGDLVHQNRILCESEENDSQYCSVDFSFTSSL